MKIAKFRQTILVVPCLSEVWSFRPLRWDSPTGKWVDIEPVRLRPDRVDGYKYVISKVARIVEDDGWKVSLSVDEQEYVCEADNEIVGVYKIFTLTCEKEEIGEEIVRDIESIYDCTHTGFSKSNYCERCGDHIDDMLEMGRMGTLYESNKSKRKNRGVSRR